MHLDRQNQAKIRELGHCSKGSTVLRIAGHGNAKRAHAFLLLKPKNCLNRTSFPSLPPTSQDHIANEAMQSLPQMLNYYNILGEFEPRT